MNRSIDLDAARAARGEAEGGRTLTFRGETFPLPDEAPYELIAPLGRLNVDERDLGALDEILEVLLGEDVERFRRLRPSIDDVNELIGKLWRDYGLAPPTPDGAVDGDAEGGGGDGPKSPPSSRA